MPIRIMTWNIWSGKNWKDIIRFVKNKKIEIMGFQEVDNNFRATTKFIDVCKTIADVLGFYYAYCPSIEIRKNDEIRQYGNCIISKFPILEHQRHFLSPDTHWDGKTPETEPRTLLETKIKIRNKILYFMTLHLAYAREFKSTDVKLKQIKTVLKVIKKHKDRSIVLLGDFNSLPESQEIKEIEKYLINVDNKNKTWTMYDFNFRGWHVTKGLKYKIDYIFVSKDIKYKNLEVPKTGLSDHLPLMLVIDFK